MHTKPKLARLLLALATLLGLLLTTTTAATAHNGNGNGNKGGKGGDATIDATVDCNPATLTITSTEHAISNVIIEFANGETTTIDDPFENAELFSYDIAIDLDNLITAVWIKAGNNGDRGKKNTGRGDKVEVDATDCLDTDGDGIRDDVDNCPTAANPDQANNLAHLGITYGDACLVTDFNINGVNDLDEYEVACIVVWYPGDDEVTVVASQSGNLFCGVAQPTSDLGPNTAIGFRSTLFSRVFSGVQSGANNTAIVIGGLDPSISLETYARVVNGDKNTALTDGTGTSTHIGGGSGNTLIARSFAGSAFSRGGDNNTAFISAELSHVDFYQSDNNTVSITERDSQANLSLSDGNTVTLDVTEARVTLNDVHNTTVIGQDDGCLLNLIGTTDGDVTCSAP